MTYKNLFDILWMFQKENIFGLLLTKQAKPTERERKRSFRLVFLIYASNEPKSVLARDLGDCRDNLRNSRSVFLIVL